MKLLVPVFVLVSGLVCIAGCRSKGTPGTETNANVSSVAAVTATQTDAEQPPPELTREQNEARALLEQGKDLFRQDRDKEAAETFEKALALDPDYGEAHFRLGLAYASLGKREEAEEEYKKAAEAYKKYVRTNQKDPDAFFYMGLSYSKVGDHAEAVKAYRQAVKLQPDDGDLQYELGLSLSRLAQYPEAVIALQKAIDLDPDNYRAGEALEKAKEGAERVRVLQKREEDLLRRQEAAKRSNQNGLNSNSAPVPAPTATP